LALRICTRPWDGGHRSGRLRTSGAQVFGWKKREPAWE
jgi:hypothetical protein